MRRCRPKTNHLTHATYKKKNTQPHTTLAICGNDGDDQQPTLSNMVTMMTMTTMTMNYSSQVIVQTATTF